MPSDPTRVSITIVSDFICPWCYIGEARLRAALADLPDGVAPEIRWYPFELNPDMPEEGRDRRAYRAAKFGSWERSRTLDAGTIEAAAGDVTFDYDAITRTPSTFAAHRLTWMAGEVERQTAVAAAILRAYFREGRDIGDPAVLAAIAAAQGMEGDIEARLRAGEGADEVRALQAATPPQVRGVPFYVIGRYGISGAQPAGTLRDAIRAAAVEAKEAA